MSEGQLKKLFLRYKEEKRVVQLRLLDKTTKYGYVIDVLDDSVVIQSDRFNEEYVIKYNSIDFIGSASSDSGDDAGDTKWLGKIDGRGSFKRYD